MTPETKTMFNSLSLTYFYSPCRSFFPLLNHKKLIHIPWIHKHMMYLYIYLYYLLVVHIYLYTIIVNIFGHLYNFHDSTRLTNSVNMTIILFIFTFSHRNFFIFFQISYNIIRACYVYMFRLQRWAVYICLSWNKYHVLFCSAIL